MTTARGFTYDTGALIAAERGDRSMWARHENAILERLTVTVPAGVLAQVWRGGPQPLLSRFLKVCDIEPLTETQARDLGRLAATSKVTDIVDLAVAEGAMRRGDAVVTSDRSDIEQIANSVGKRLAIQEV